MEVLSTLLSLWVALLTGIALCVLSFHFIMHVGLPTLAGLWHWLVEILTEKH